MAVVLSTGIFLGGAYLIGRYFRKNPFRKATVRVAARALIISFAVLLFYELKALSWTGKEIALENLENAWPTLQHYLSRSIPLFERPNYHLLLIANGFREADGLLLTVLAASSALCFLVPYRMEEIEGERDAREEAQGLHGSRAFATPKQIRKGASKGVFYLGVQRESGLDEEIRATPSGHLLTIAGTGGGKTRSVLIQNALEYPHQLILLDPKGVVSRVVAEERKARTGRDYYIIDPNAPSFSDSLNLISWIDPESETAFEDCAILADAFTSSDLMQGENQHWEEAARTLVQFGIFLILSDPKIGTKDIGEVRRLLSSVDFFNWIRETKARVNELPNAEELNIQIDGLLTDAEGDDKKVINSVRTTQKRMLNWLSTSRLKNIANGAIGRQIPLDAVMRGEVDIYLDIPAKYLRETNRGFARATLGLLLTKTLEYRRDTHHKAKTLFLLDEFFQIGRMACFTEARDTGREAGIKLWPLFQSLTQIETAWGKADASTWIANSDVRQYFKINAIETAEYVSKDLGTKTVKVSSESATQNDQRGQRTGGSGGDNQKTEQRRLMLEQEVRDIGPYEQLLVFNSNIGVPPVHAKLKLYTDKYPKLAANDPEA